MIGLKVHIDTKVKPSDNGLECINTLQYVKIVNQHPDLLYTLDDVKQHDEMYLVWAECSWGINNHVEPLGIFLNELDADRFARFISLTEYLDSYKKMARDKCYSQEMFNEDLLKLDGLNEFSGNLKCVLDNPSKCYSGSNNCTIIYESNDGQVFSYKFFTWTGTFDKLENVNVDWVKLK